MNRRHPITRSANTGILLLAALVTTAGPSCKKSDDAGSGKPAGSSPKKAPDASAQRVEVAVLDGGSATERIVRPGEVIGSREANVAAALGGYVEAVLVRSGQEVKKNQVLARIDSSTHAAQHQLSKVELADAERELARLQKMGKAVIGARVDAATTRVERARAQKRLVVIQLDRATIRAPFDGVLVGLDIERGEVVAPGAPIGRVLLLDPIRVTVSVTDRDIGRLSTGDGAVVMSAGSVQPIQGTIARIEPSADQRTRTFLIEVEIPNPQRRLLPGMIAAVEFRPSSSSEQGTTLLPQDLLVTNLDGNGVFVVDDKSIARWRPLELGKIIGDQFEVKGGLQKGVRLVSVGQRSLEDGDRVMVTREGRCCVSGRITYPAAKQSPPASAPPAEAAKPPAAELPAEAAVPPRGGEVATP